MINSKITFNGIIQLTSPLLVGNGKDDNSDNDVLKDSEGMPYIPATSFVGILRHRMKNIEDKNLSYTTADFFGFSNSKFSKQSDFCCSDLTLSEDLSYTIYLRDGIEIDNITGFAKDKSKFDYEIIEKGCKFELKFFFNLNENIEENEIKLGFLQVIINLLKNDKIAIGAKTNNGFGKFELISENIFHYDFNSFADVKSYLSNKPSNKRLNFNDLTQRFNIKEDTFKINATLSIKNSIIFRDYYNDGGFDADTSSKKSNEEYIIPGSSLKGVIRSHCEKILNYFFLDEELVSMHINNLFGFVSEDKKNAKKGKLSVKESTISNVHPYLQTRIKIDRFTGAAISSALFNSLPLYPLNQDEESIKISIEVRKPSETEIGLLLLVLKDIWSGRVAFGGEKNIGRGVLKGILAEIEINGHKILLDSSNKSDSIKQLSPLQKYLDSLVKLGEE